jgi:HK97 gp10 family phage protein
MRRQQVSFSASATALSDRSAIVSAKIRAAVRQSVEQACDLIKEEAQAIVPVRTGALRDSIGWSVADEDPIIVGTVSATMPYAGYVEWGTGRRGAESPGHGPYPYTMTWPGMVAQPYMRPAVDTARGEIKGLLVSNVQMALK